MQCCDLPYQPHTAPANGQNVQCRRRGRRNDRDALKSGGPPEDFRRVLQRLRRPGTQERKHRSPECQLRPEPARSQSAAVALPANAVPPAEPYPPLHWQIHRGADQPCAALRGRAVRGRCQRRSGRARHTRTTRPAQPSAPQRSNSALTSQAPQSTGMPSPRIAAPISAGDARQRTGSAVGNSAGTASRRGAALGLEQQERFGRSVHQRMSVNRNAINASSPSCGMPPRPASGKRIGSKSGKARKRCCQNKSSGKLSGTSPG